MQVQAIGNSSLVTFDSQEESDLCWWLEDGFSHLLSYTEVDFGDDSPKGILITTRNIPLPDSSPDSGYIPAYTPSQDLKVLREKYPQASVFGL